MSETKANSKHGTPSRLFAYGTLAEPEVMQALLGRVPPFLPAHIDDHAAYRMREGVYPGLILEPGQVTTGRLYEAIEPAELDVIEAFEDEDYERAQAWVVGPGGLAQRALCYRIPEQMRHLLSDQRWDPAAFRREHLPAYVEMCAAFRDRCSP